MHFIISSNQFRNLIIQFTYFISFFNIHQVHFCDHESWDDPARLLSNYESLDYKRDNPKNIIYGIVQLKIEYKQIPSQIELLTL